MRIVIDTDDRASAAAATQPAIELGKSEVFDAGQPPAELLEAVNSAASPPSSMKRISRGLPCSSKAEVGALGRYAELFRGPALPAGDVVEAEHNRLAARDMADALGLPIGNAVDFWTEASLFSQAGLTAIVFGPGDIAQAHTADEWVALHQLQSYAEAVKQIIETPQ